MYIEPVILEDASWFQAPEDSVAYTADEESSAETGVWGPPRVKGSKPFVQQVIIDNEDGTNETYDTRDYVNPDDINLADFDWSFGLYDSFPGIQYLAKLSGPLNFTMGFLNGT